MAVKRGEPGAKLPALRRERRVTAPRAAAGHRAWTTCPPGPTSATDNAGARRRPSSATGWSRASRSPTTPPTWTSGPPSWASGASSPPAAEAGPSYEELVETEGRPRLRMWLERIQTEGLVEAAVVYGYFPCRQRGQRPGRARRRRAASGSGSPSPPAPRPAPVPGRLLPAAAGSGETDVVGFQLVTVGTQDQPGDRASCSPRTPTATTSSCTACRYS